MMDPLLDLTQILILVYNLAQWTSILVTMYVNISFLILYEL